MHHILLIFHSQAFLFTTTVLLVSIYLQRLLIPPHFHPYPIIFHQSSYIHIQIYGYLHIKDDIVEHVERIFALINSCFEDQSLKYICFSSLALLLNTITTVAM